MTSLFSDISDSVQTVPAILLIDASGSTRGSYIGHQTIIDRMAEVCKTIPNEQFRMIFWNSPNSNQTNLISGSHSQRTRLLTIV